MKKPCKVEKMRAQHHLEDHRGVSVVENQGGQSFCTNFLVEKWPRRRQPNHALRETRPRRVAERAAAWRLNFSKITTSTRVRKNLLTLIITGSIKSVSLIYG